MLGLERGGDETGGLIGLPDAADVIVRQVTLLLGFNFDFAS